MIRGFANSAAVALTIFVSGACQSVATDDVDRVAVSYENITFIGGDGRDYVNYATTRSEAPSFTLFLEKSASLSDYLYINPPGYELDTTQPERNRLTFPEGGYALMSQGRLEPDAADGSRVTMDDDGIYTLATWSGETLASGRYGYWNQPNDFAHFAIAWSFADGFEPIAYISNREGRWERRGNTLAFFAEAVNDLTFEIRYRARSQLSFASLREALADEPEIRVEQAPDAVNLILQEEILFGSGNHRISAAGRSVIDKIVATLARIDGYRIEVSGHTDDVPISGALAGAFKDNWGLSAQRAINVIRALERAGVQGDRMRLSAHGATQPRAPNDSDAGRQANRRIEISILTP